MLDSIFVAAHFVVMHELYIGDNIQRGLAKQTKSIHLYFYYLKFTTVFEETLPVNEGYVQESILRSLALFFTIVLLLFMCTHTTCTLISGPSWTAAYLVAYSFKQNNDSLLRSSMTQESRINSDPCCRNFGKPVEETRMQLAE